MELVQVVFTGIKPYDTGSEKIQMQFVNSASSTNTLMIDWHTTISMHIFTLA